MSAGGRFLMRNFRHTALTTRDRVIFVGAGGQTIVQGTDAPSRWSDTLQRLARPVKRDTAARMLGPGLLQRLAASGDLLEADDEQTLIDDQRLVFNTAPAFHLEADPPACGQLLFGCCGSVVAGLMAQTLLSLLYCGFQQRLDVILTRTATRFLAPDLLESYGIRCWQDAFERKEGIRVPHVSLARAADLIIVCPATAASLARLAHSACSDLLSLCITASAAPVLVVPAMNSAMWNDAGVQRNLETLREARRFVMEPAIIFGAADFAASAPPMFGGHGSLWGGPRALMHAAVAVLRGHASPCGPAGTGALHGRGAPTGEPGACGT